MPNAQVTVTETATGSVRTLTTNTEGLYSAPALPSGEYAVRAELQGFRTLVRGTQVTAGSVSTVDMAMTLGAASEVVTVQDSGAQVNYDDHAIAGVVQRSNIQDLPINGRSFLSLATLEPGVTTAPGTAAQFNSLISVTTLGGGGYTRFTIDGGIVVNDEWEGTGTTGMNFSPGDRTGLPDLNSQFRCRRRHWVRRAGQRGDAQRQQQSSREWVFLLSRSQYGGLPRPEARSEKSRSRSSHAAILAYCSAAPFIKNKFFFFVNYEYM